MRSGSFLCEATPWPLGWQEFPGRHDSSVTASSLRAASYLYVPTKGIRLPHRHLLWAPQGLEEMELNLCPSPPTSRLPGSSRGPFPSPSCLCCSSAVPCPSHPHPASWLFPSRPLSRVPLASQWFSPLSCHQLLGPGLLRLGRLWLRSPSHTALAPGLWLSGFGLLRGDHLFLCPAPGPGPPAPEDMVHLRRLQEISEQGWGWG